ncbi:MAG: FMN-binding protein [Alkalispirochaetaceae bacterium]
MRSRGTVYTVIFTFAVTFVITLLLSATNSFTAPMAELHGLERRQRAVLAALDVFPESREEVFDAYEQLETFEAEGVRLYSREREEGDSEELSGRLYAKEFSGPGVWGPIVGIVSVNSRGERIFAVEILDQNETPGLGGRITEEEFLRQFRGELVGPEGLTMVPRSPGDYDPDNSSIDGIAGATGTSRAFRSIMNREIETLRRALEDGSDLSHSADFR